MKEWAQLVDVRSPAEYAARHIECAINLTLSTIESCAGELGDQPKPVTLYCRSANRSGCLAKLHQRLGFGAVYNL
ncbi:MAG: rhodanese-like domain-containing protein [Myxococcota bacterium]|nr:rhodanese-like domain-containing protein [Myxococcota bacterium]